MRYDPFEVTLAVVFGASAILQFFFGSPPGSASASLSESSRLLWLILLLSGCVATLLGAASTRVRGYLIEQAGLVATGWTLIAFGTQVLILQIQHGQLSPATILGGPLTMTLGFAFLWKRQQVWSDVKALRGLRDSTGE